MALTDDELTEVRLLDAALRKAQKTLRRYDRYLEGEQPLQYMAPQLEAEVGSLVTQLVINWPMLAVSSYEHRLDVKGFRYPDSSDPDEALAAWWRHVEGDEQSQLAHFEALGLSRAYAIVGSGDEEDDPPVLTIESPMDVITRRDPRTRRVLSGLKTWVEDDGSKWGQLYLPDQSIVLERKGRNGWADEDRDDHELGECTVVPLVHRPRVSRPDGRSLFHDIIPIADAANKMATDMMVSGEFHAMPRRWALGFSEEDFVDEHGKQLDTWSQVAGRLWASEKGPDEAAVGQFPEADLAVFHNTVKLLAQLVAQLMGLPQDYLGFQTDNPPTAESRKAAEVQMIKGAERMSTWFGGGWKRVGQLFLRFESADGELPEGAEALTTVWGDPATPTKAQQADFTAKLVEAKVLPIEQARIDLGYDEEQRRRMAEMDDAAARRSLALLAEAAGGAAEKPPAA